jgi:outer membrane protein TolC
VELARLSTLGMHQTWRRSVRDKVREVQGAYLDLVFALADLQVQRQSLDLAEQQVRLTQVRVESGALPRIEITSAESGRAGRRVDVVTAESRAVESEDRLRRLILAFDSPSEWQVRLIPTEMPVERYVEVKEVEQILVLAERSEPDLLRAHLAAAQAEIVLGQRQSEREVRLDLRGSAEFTGLDDEFWDAHRLAFSQGRGAASWRLGLSLEVPLGNRTTSARVAQSELALRKARINLQDARTEMVFRVRSALRNIEVARRTIAARKEASRLAAEQLENERLRLELKTSTNFQVFQVEDQLNRRRTEEIRALLDYRLACLELSRVTALPLDDLLKD